MTAIAEVKEKFVLVICLNDRGADGTDISWIWDADFEKLCELSGRLEKVIVSGDLASDMAVRVKYAGIDPRFVSMERDYEKAFHYFALGAFDGHLISLYKIGDMYLNGYYVSKNEKEAFHIYMRCLETMTDEAAETVAGPVYLRLGKMLLHGIGTDRDLKGALVCYQKAEAFLYDMVKDGNAMYRKSLDAAIAGQEKVRKQMQAELPANQWIFD